MDSSNTEVSGYGPQNLNFVQAMIDVGQIFFQLVEGLEVNYVRIWRGIADPLIQICFQHIFHYVLYNRFIYSHKGTTSTHQRLGTT